MAQSQPVPPESEAAAPSTDPTVAHAGLTELDDGTTLAESTAEAPETPTAPPAASVDGGAANAAADEQWDKQGTGSDDPLAESFEMVPRDPAETESPAATAPNNSTQSWADDAHEQAAAATPASNGDGFHEVQHARGRGRGGFQGEGRGGFRGGRGGPRGDGRGRGRARGDFRGGRGRGSFRGGERGGPRGDSH